MSDSQENYRQVVFELPNKHVPELMEILGGFVAEHNISIEFNDTEAQSPSLKVEDEQPRYNPDLVEWVSEGEDESLIAVIPLDKIKLFAEQLGYSSGQQGYSNGLVSRAANAVWRYIEERDRYLYGTFSYDIGAGFKANAFGELIKLLHRMDIPNLGAKGLDFLREVQNNLILPEAEKEAEITDLSEEVEQPNYNPELVEWRRGSIDGEAIEPVIILDKIADTYGFSVQQRIIKHAFRYLDTPNKYFVFNEFDAVYAMRASSFRELARELRAITGFSKLNPKTAGALSEILTNLILPESAEEIPITQEVDLEAHLSRQLPPEAPDYD